MFPTVVGGGFAKSTVCGNGCEKLEAFGGGFEKSVIFIKALLFPPLAVVDIEEICAEDMSPLLPKAIKLLFDTIGEIGIPVESETYKIK